MNFDWKFYINHYEDLPKNGIINEKLAKLHWDKHGKNEGRICNNDSDIISKTGKHIYVFGGFKNGTNTLASTFKCGRGHEFPWEISENIYNKLKFIIIPFRNNSEIYPSAFFQDIIEQSYPYSPFNKKNFLGNSKDLYAIKKIKIINQIDINLLIDFYKRINWDSMLHLNNIKRLELINNRFNINIDYNSELLQIFTIGTGDNIKKILSFNINSLHKIFDELVKEIYNDTSVDIKIVNNNIGSNKWYANKYKQFKNKLLSL